MLGFSLNDQKKIRKLDLQICKILNINTVMSTIIKSFIIGSSWQLGINMKVRASIK